MDKIEKSWLLVIAVLLALSVMTGSALTHSQKQEQNSQE